VAGKPGKRKAGDLESWEPGNPGTRESLRPGVPWTWTTGVLGDWDTERLEKREVWKPEPQEPGNHGNGKPGRRVRW